MSIENFKNPWVDKWKKGGEFDPDWLGENKALELIKNENQMLTRKSFPSPSIIMSNYSNDRFTNEANECAVRLSIALIESGVNISGSSRFRTLIKTNDGRMVQPSAAALADWISTTIGQPKIFNHPHGKWQKNDFISKEGLYPPDQTHLS